MVGRSLLIGLAMAVVLFAANDTRLADAAERGDREAVRTLLKQKADVNAVQGDGSTALHWAAYKDDVDMARLLLAAGANVKATTRIGGITPLSMASKNGNAAIIDALLQAGGDANYIDERGTTALMTAAASGNADAVRILIDHGSDVNARDGSHGQTPLMFAAALNRGAAIRTLLEHGANPSITTKAVKLPKAARRFDDGATPEPKEAAAPKPSADKASLDALANSLGFKSAEYRTGKPEPSDVKELVQKLIARVDELEKRLPEKPKADDDPTRPTRERGTQDLGGMTALLFAARDGQLDAARALLEGGADINQVSASDQTSPIVLAIINGHFDLGKFLLDWGADPNIANSQGLAALYATLEMQWIPKGWTPAPLTAQEKITYMELMKALLDAGANPNARLAKKLWYRTSGDHSWIDTAGATPFFRAAQSSDLEAMKLLVSRGADPDIPTLGGATPLMAAAGIGWGYHYNMNVPDNWMPTVKYCVQLGADVNAADSRGYTAIHGAAYLGNNEMVNYLIEKGADVKAVAKDKNTVADMANGPTRFGIPHPETLALLEKLGSANSHNCRSDQCLVAPKEDKKSAKPGEN
jgi:ankyrin repeat protein